MKKLFIVLFLAAFLFLSTPNRTFAFELNPQNQTVTNTLDSLNTAVEGERINNFDSKIVIHKDGSIKVTETIKYYFDTDRHGIYRYIPFTKYDSNKKRYDLKFDFEPVTDEKNKKYKVSKSREGEDWVLKIGDPDKTITGEHTYIISYTVKGALGYFKDHDELYWNVTGTGWNVPIKKATTTILFPQALSDARIKLSCFTGSHGSDRKNCTGTSNGSTTRISTTLFLNSYEGLTIVKGFPKGIIKELLPEVYVPFFERWYGKIALAGIIITAIFWYILLPIYLIIRWFQKGRDPNVGIAVTATFDPPKIGKRFLTPAEAGALLDEHVDKRDLFATIVDLARRGHLKISEPQPKEFHLIKTTPKKTHSASSRQFGGRAGQALLPFEQTLYNGIFATGDDVKLKEVKFYTTASLVETQLYTLLVDHKYFPKSPRTTRTIYYGIGGLAMFTFNFVLAFISFVFGRNMPRKTLLGAQASKQAQGLKNFLTSQEKQLNFQGDKQMLFEKLLPVAVAFGVEKAWAKRFADLNLKNPNWYQGTSGSHFNSAVFASNMTNSYSSFASSATPPSSSGSGFSGGSSGGGGGGGGGGSW